MLITDLMEKAHHANDNLQLGFITLAAITAVAIRHLERTEEQEKQRDRDTDRGKTQEQRDEDESAYIEQRLKDIEAFEDRARGRKRF
jgi:hypothetical protein